MIFSENQVVNPEKMIEIHSFFLVFPNVPKDFRDFKVTYILQNHWTRDRRARDAYILSWRISFLMRYHNNNLRVAAVILM